MCHMLFNQFPRRIVGHRTSLFESRRLNEAQQWIHCLLSEKNKKQKVVFYTPKKHQRAEARLKL